MKKVTYRNQISKISGISLVVLLFFSTTFFAQDEVASQEVEAVVVNGGDATKGKALFNQNCAACHSMDRKMTGPALANVEVRLLEDEGLDKSNREIRMPLRYIASTIRRQ